MNLPGWMVGVGCRAQLVTAKLADRQARLYGYKGHRVSAPRGARESLNSNGQYL